MGFLAIISNLILAGKAGLLMTYGGTVWNVVVPVYLAYLVIAKPS